MIIRLAPALFVCLWATGFVGAKLGMPHAEPATFLSLRFIFALVILIAISLAFSARWPNRSDALHAMVVGALVHGVYLGGVFWAVRNGMPGGVAAIVVGLQPLLSAVLAGLWLKEEITLRHWAGLGVGLVGIALVIVPKLDISNSGINATTIGVSLISVIGISVGTIYQKRFATNIDLRTGTALQYVGALIPTGIYALLFENLIIDWNPQSIFAMAWLVIVLSITGIFLLMWLIREGSAARVSSLFYLVPAVAALMVWFLFGETLTSVQILGAALCAMAVALSAAKPRRSQNA